MKVEMLRNDNVIDLPRSRPHRLRLRYLYRQTVSVSVAVSARKSRFSLLEVYPEVAASLSDLPCPVGNRKRKLDYKYGH